MNKYERMLMANAVEQDDIVVSKIAHLFALTEREVVSIAEPLVNRGLLEQVRPDAYRATELGRTTLDSIDRAEHAKVKRGIRFWGRAA